MSTCLITGCALYFEARGSLVWGDLHGEGDCLIFNAVLGPDGNAAWQFNRPPETVRCVNYTATHGPGPFERRGVIVMRMADCAFSGGVTEYLEGSTEQL